MVANIAVTVPIKPKGMKWKSYKHYKPLEHIHHFTEESLVALMESFGFRLFKSGYPECPPRKYIASFLFVRKDNNAKVNTGKSAFSGRHTVKHKRNKGST
jgi:hypothetical protein